MSEYPLSERVRAAFCGHSGIVPVPKVTYFKWLDEIAALEAKVVELRTARDRYYKDVLRLEAKVAMLEHADKLLMQSFAALEAERDHWKRRALDAEGSLVFLGAALEEGGDDG